MGKNKMNNKKFYVIVGIFCILFLGIGMTYAWLTWNSSENTNFTLRLGEVGEALFSGGNEISASGMGPVLSPLEEGSYTEFQILKKTDTSFSVTIDFLPTVLPEELKDASFKYALYSKETESGTYSYITEGDFSDKESGTQFTILNTQITTTTYYKLVIYIDGTMENTSNVQGQSFAGTIYISYNAFKDPTITTDATTVSATVGDTVDLLNGITAVDSDGTTVLTPSVTVNGTQVMNTSGATTAIGLTSSTNTVVYTVTSASGQTATVTRTYTINTKSVTQYRKGTEKTTTVPSCPACACGANGEETCVGCAVCPQTGTTTQTTCTNYGSWTTTYQSGSCVQTRTCTMQPNGSCS